MSTIDDKVWAGITDYEDILMQEQGGVKWCFPFTNKTKQLPDMPETSHGDTSKREGGGIGVEKKNGGGKTEKKNGGKEQASSSNFSVLNEIEEMNEKWLPIKRPVPQIQKILRGIIIDLVAQDLTKGTFTIHDVWMENSLVKVEVAESESSLRHSLLTTAKNVLGDKPDSKELFMFYNAIKKCKSVTDYRQLYFQPLLYTTRETIYFFLDLLLIGRDKARFLDFHMALNTPFEISPMVMKMKKTERLKGILKTNDVGLKRLLANKKDSTLRTFLGIVKGIFHHYQQLLGENLSMDSICELLYEVFEGAHAHVFENLVSYDCDIMCVFL